MKVLQRLFSFGMKTALEPVNTELREISARLEQIQHRLNGHLDEYGAFEKRLTSDVQAVVELFGSVQRSLDALSDQTEISKTKIPSA